MSFALANVALGRFAGVCHAIEGNTIVGVGTRLSMTIVAHGTPSLYCWDINNHDNWGEIRAVVQVSDGPRT